MAYRTVKRMLAKALLLERSNSLGGLSLVLAAKGVTRLRELDVSSVEGYDMSSIGGPQFFHRTLGSCFLIDRARNSQNVFGEYALQRNWAPLTIAQLKQHYKKIPDGLTVAAGESRGYSGQYKAVDWIEVESSFKSELELIKILLLGLRLPEPIQESSTLIMDQVVFVYDTRQGHEVRILRTLRALLKDRPELNQVEALSRIVMARAAIDVPMQWHGVSEHTAWELLQGLSLAPEGSHPSVQGQWDSSYSDKEGEPFSFVEEEADERNNFE
jgi:hypothetical protein